MKEQTSWKIRRFLMFVVLAFCMTIIWKVVDANIDTETARTALTYSYWVIFGIMVIYVFGVVTDEQLTKFINSKIE